jgi:hypothetical protein
VLNILWDASHLWGYLLLHAVRSAELPHRLLKGTAIAQAGLSGKVLAVPGGSARRKAAALGPAGQGAVRRFVAGGGHYLGLCGGAGLALSEGLALCPWGRSEMADRLQHMVSGHLECAVEEGHPLAPAGMKKILLPVWWPARFDEPRVERVRPVEVLARYRAPGADLCVADLPFSMLPASVLAEWAVTYGVVLRPSLLDNQPCVIAGPYERGSWLLSYSHLETPGAGGDGDANRWLFHLLSVWGIPGGEGGTVPEWRPDALPVAWEDPVLLAVRRDMDRLLALAEDLGLLFRRESWLRGWRAGMPGAQFNGLHVALATALSLEATDRRRAWWAERAPAFQENFRLFGRAAESWLLARRLADTLDSSAPGVLPRALLVEQKDMLFGSPMSSGGLCGQLQDDLEGLLF